MLAVATIISPMGVLLADSAAKREQDDAVFVREHLPGDRAMTKLLTVQFQTGRPKLNPDEETQILLQTSRPVLQASIRNPAVALVIIGYVDRGGDAAENKKAAFRRAQLVIDLLRDKCGLAASTEAATLEIGELPVAERTGKPRTVEVWAVNP